MTEADGIDDDNLDNVVEKQPKNEDFISEVGQPVSAMESEDDDDSSDNVVESDDSDGDREDDYNYITDFCFCDREEDYDYDYITDYMERAIEKKQAKSQKQKISMYEWKRLKTSEISMHEWKELKTSETSMYVYGEGAIKDLEAKVDACEKGGRPVK